VPRALKSFPLASGQKKRPEVECIYRHRWKWFGQFHPDPEQTRSRSRLKLFECLEPPRWIGRSFSVPQDPADLGKSVRHLQVSEVWMGEPVDEPSFVADGGELPASECRLVTSPSYGSRSSFTEGEPHRNLPVPNTREVIKCSGLVTSLIGMSHLARLYVLRYSF